MGQKCSVGGSVVGVDDARKQQLQWVEDCKAIPRGECKGGGCCRMYYSWNPNPQFADGSDKYAHCFASDPRKRWMKYAGGAAVVLAAAGAVYRATRKSGDLKDADAPSAPPPEDQSELDAQEFMNYCEGRLGKDPTHIENLQYRPCGAIWAWRQKNKSMADLRSDVDRQAEGRRELDRRDAEKQAFMTYCEDKLGPDGDSREVHTGGYCASIWTFKNEKTTTALREEVDAVAERRLTAKKREGLRQKFMAACEPQFPEGGGGRPAQAHCETIWYEANPHWSEPAPDDGYRQALASLSEYGEVDV